MGPPACQQPLTRGQGVPRGVLPRRCRGRASAPRPRRGRRAPSLGWGGPGLTRRGRRRCRRVHMGSISGHRRPLPQAYGSYNRILSRFSRSLASAAAPEVPRPHRRRTPRQVATRAPGSAARRHPRARGRRGRGSYGDVEPVLPQDGGPRPPASRRAVGPPPARLARLARLTRVACHHLPDPAQPRARRLAVAVLPVPRCRTVAYMCPCGHPCDILLRALGPGPRHLRQIGHGQVLRDPGQAKLGVPVRVTLCNGRPRSRGTWGRRCRLQRGGQAGHPGREGVLLCARRAGAVAGRRLGSTGPVRLCRHVRGARRAQSVA